MGEVCLVLLVPFVAIQLAISGPFAVAADPQPAAADPGPVADWLDDVIDDLEDAADDLEDAESAVTAPGGPRRSVIAAALDDARVVIGRILGHPNMEEKGRILVETEVTSLEEYAAECRVLVADALHEAVSPRVDLDDIATRLMTLEHLLTRSEPHNYYTKAGLKVSNQ